MTIASLPTDKWGNPIQVLSPGVTVRIAIGATSASIAIPNSSPIVRLAASHNCAVKFGDSSVVATVEDMFLPDTDNELFEVPLGATHVATLETTGGTNGFLWITEMN